MSARLHLSRNTKPRAVELPPEVWVLIFDWTTHVPEAYDPDYLPQSFTNPPSKAQNLDRIKSFRSRSSLARVCKPWSVIARRYLFEHIVITKDTHIPPLYNALLRARDNAESGSTAPHPGFYTRRLDISLKTSDVNKAITDLGDIIRWFPNLSFITISLGFVDRPQRGFCYYGRDGVLAALAVPLLDALCSTCTSLEVIEVLYQSSFYISNSDLRRVLSSFSKLRSFRNEGNMEHILDPRIHVPCFHLAASLTTVALDDRESNSMSVTLSPNPDIFPSLQTVMFYTKTMADRQFLSFIEIHGSTLTTVMIRYAKTIVPQIFFGKLLSTIRRSCPRVVNFMVWFDFWHWTNGPAGLDAFQLPPSIRVFGVRCKEVQAESWAYEKFFLWVIPQDGRVLRLLDERHVTDLCQKHALTFKKIRQRLEQGGWQFQGPDERVLL